MMEIEGLVCFLQEVESKLSTIRYLSKSYEDYMKDANYSRDDDLLLHLLDEKIREMKERDSKA